MAAYKYWLGYLLREGDSTTLQLSKCAWFRLMSNGNTYNRKYLVWCKRTRRNVATPQAWSGLTLQSIKTLLGTIIMTVGNLFQKRVQDPTSPSYRNSEADLFDSCQLEPGSIETLRGDNVTLDISQCFHLLFKDCSGLFSMSCTILKRNYWHCLWQW